MIKRLFTALLFLTATLLAASQDTVRITHHFAATPFESFVQYIESTTAYRFYFRAADVDSFTITATAERQTISQLLKQVFQTTPYQFIIDASDKIYVSKSSTSLTNLPPDFFDPTKPSAITTNKTVVQADMPVTQPKLKSSIENKLFQIGPATTSPKQKVTLAGYIRDVKNGEPVAGVSIAVDSLSAGVMSDGFGYYSLTVPSGRHLLRINATGMKTTSRQVQLNADGSLDIELAEYVASLKEVVVTSIRTSNVRSLNMGKDRLSIQTIKQIPVVFGEADVLRAVLTLPGVTSVGEANTGLNVRGGAADQNLILLNDATIYNPSHLFGFFSSFNPDIVKSVELYKSAIPEKYGGRLSSVLDVTTKQGNTKKVTGEAGIGPLTSKVMIEGPISKKTTFIVSARSSYSDWLLRQVPNSAYQNSKANFYDADLHLSHTINIKNSLYINGYISHDGFRLNGDTAYRYGNKNLNLKWKHNFNNQFYGIATAGIDRYNYDISSETNSTTAYRLSFGIQQNYLRTDFTYTPNLKHLFTFGLTSVYYKIQPGTLAASGQSSLVKADQLSNEQALESALYLGDEYTVSSKLSVHAGLRYSLFNYLGPHDQYLYKDGIAKDKNTLLDTTSFASGKIIKTYGNPELRLAMRYTLSDNASLKASFNTTTQYIHTLSNTNSISPTDVFKLSDAYIRPQQGSQVSVGYYQNFGSNTIETSIEVYYKRMNHYLDYKSGATLLLNHHIETDIINTRGKAYGAELLVKKTSGKLTGWVGYTYSKVMLQSDDALAEQINSGKFYPANFDKPHNANVTANYKFSHRYSLSIGTSYSTGRPITLPLAVFNLGGAQRVFYSERNQFRTPDYFRADVSFMMEGNPKTTKATHNAWSFGVYNLTGRKNVYSIYFIEEGGYIKGYKLSIFGTPIPFVTYTIRF